MCERERVPRHEWALKRDRKKTLCVFVGGFWWLCDREREIEQIEQRQLWVLVALATVRVCGCGMNLREGKQESNCECQYCWNV